MKSVIRTFTLSACNGQHIGPSGDFEDFTDVLIGDYDTVKATRALRRKHDDESIIINNVERETKKYKLDALKFMAEAEIID